MIKKMFYYIGHNFTRYLQTIGSLFLFMLKCISCSITLPLYVKNILLSILEIGYRSLPLIAMTAIFTGGVLALQTHAGFSRLHAEDAIATIVLISITRELGPVIGGLMIAGRVGSAIAAEIGTMRITEQIDALKTLSINPYRYLFVPRIIASTISVPILVLIADIIGIYGGYIVATKKLGFNNIQYLHSTISALEINDVKLGLIKATFFGFIIALSSCYHGNKCQKGAKGVGQSTTNSLVYSSLFILFSNYLITELFFS